VPLRLLHLADLHLDRAFAGMGCHGDLARRRRQGLRDALRRAGGEAQRRDCQVITIGGDLYEHERAGPDTGRFLAETFAAWRPMRVVLAAGNHDALLPGSLYARTEWPDNVHLFTENRLRPLELDEGLTLWGLSHREPAWMGDPLDGEPVGGDGGVHLALFHGSELGSRPQDKSLHGPFRAGAVSARGFAAALCGHYHRRRVDTEARLLYPGSPEPLAFDEESPRGPVVVEVDGAGLVSYEPLDLAAWMARTAEADLGGCTSLTGVVDACCAVAAGAIEGCDADRTMLRLHLSGELAPEVAVDIPTVETCVREATGAALVRARDLTLPGLDLEASLADPTARGLFTRELLGAIETAGVDDPERAVLADALRYGLEALAGVEVGLR